MAPRPCWRGGDAARHSQRVMPCWARRGFGLCHSSNLRKLDCAGNWLPFSASRCGVFSPTKSMLDKMLSRRSRAGMNRQNKSPGLAGAFHFVRRQFQSLRTLEEATQSKNCHSFLPGACPRAVSGLVSAPNPFETAPIQKARAFSENQVGLARLDHQKNRSRQQRRSAKPGATFAENALAEKDGRPFDDMLCPQSPK